MLLTNPETQKLLLAASAEEVHAVLSTANDLAAWNGAEPLADHAQCLYDFLSQFTVEQRSSLLAKELSLEPLDNGRVLPSFYGMLSDDELENVSAGGDCFPDNFEYAEGVLKPVIYLYPEQETEVTVEISEGKMQFTCVYPPLNDGKWTVTAQPDGILSANGKTYNYLYWEGKAVSNWADCSRGFCVAGSYAAEFLEKSLAALGLNRREANEMIVFWLPLLQKNPYNLISFQFETYAEMAPLHVTPAPDTVIRVYMVCKPLQEAVEIEPQELSAPERRGFTVVEWGGTI